MSFRDSIPLWPILLGVLVSGCGSIMARGYMAPDFPEKEPPPYFYRGVAAHIALISEEAADEPVWLLPIGIVMTAFDLTLCLVADTILLPVDFVVWTRRPTPPDNDDTGT